MSARPESPVSSSPFSPRTVLGLVVIGGLAFLAFLWLIGAGLTGGNPNDGQASVGGKGLNGYAAMADYLERRGFAVSRVQSLASLKQPGLLILTPPADAKGKDIAEVVTRRRLIGPTLIILPKWQVAQVGQLTPGAKPGWVMLSGVEVPNWTEFYDDISLDLKPMRAGGKVASWRGLGSGGDLPSSENVLSGAGDALVPLVVGTEDGRVLAGYIDDGDYPALRDVAEGYAPEPDPDTVDDTLYPLVMVFEPDLLNNQGFADAANAVLAEALVREVLDGGDKVVAFDLTLNGYGRSQNLLTLAFTPPFLAATLCLLLAAGVIGWRAFHRFGPPLLAGRGIAFGKRALVANAAALVRRTRRLHLIGAPYADAARDRLARALALPHRLDGPATEAAIDRALATRAPELMPFSAAAAALRAARRPADLLRAAQTLHSLERTLTR